ncbi:hypothetical protein EOV40_014140 (plasmid) [Acetobacter oryzoeni]|uniref:CN hydrolase domain-containing protein n=1 Tax=Acetobacter oryzoeni TaxID=2500548 RepID=A0A5B9GNC9_9PROT|nr:hypothetical protein [Acetobacter oryzoeni]QEE86834.1 hypothetical protein EOV40_014140 [Acetobacter oryzoeni]
MLHGHRLTEGKLLGTPLTEGEGMVIADLDFALITKRKRMMDSVGHYARPELLSLLQDRRPARTVHYVGEHGATGPVGSSMTRLRHDYSDTRHAFRPQARH